MIGPCNECGKVRRKVTNDLGLCSGCFSRCRPREVTPSMDYRHLLSERTRKALEASERQ